MRELLLWLLRPVVKSWATAADLDLAGIARPIDSPRAVAAGVDSDRILVIGSGPAVGWGVMTHDLALAGALARSVSQRTGRGAEVDVVADASVMASSGIQLLEEDKLWRYDAVVVMVGINDALALTPVAEYKREMRKIFGQIERASSLSTHTLAVGIPNISEIPAFEGAMSRIANWHARFLNRATAQLTAGLTRTTFVPLEVIASRPKPAKGSGAYRSADDYRAMAESLVDHVVAPLNLHRLPSGESESPAPFTAIVSSRGDSEAQRQRAVDALGIAGSPPEERFDRIVDSARRAFDVRSALFSIIDRDRQWNKARANFDLEEIPREWSACSITIQSPGAHIILDTHKDERIAGYPLAEGQPQFRFYAGFPVESPTGERIGSLSLLDDEPRTEVNQALLREFALLVQEELRRGQPEAVA